MTWAIPLTIALGSCALAAAGTALLLPFLRRRGVIDHPNERSSHRVATPRGRGRACRQLGGVRELARRPSYRARASGRTLFSDRGGPRAAPSFLPRRRAGH